MAIGFSLGQQWSPLDAESVSGMPSFAEALHKGIMSIGQEAESRAKPKMLSEDLLAKQLSNRINRIKGDYEERNQIANLNSVNAGTGLTSQNTLKQKILNEYLPQREPAEIGEINARRDYYEQGGPGMGVGTNNYNQFVKGLAADNPDLSPNQLRQAADIISKGGLQLPDGTKLNPMSLGTKIAFDNAIKSTTTASQINQSNVANQADAELDIFTNLANQWRAPYADTIANKSPQQIVDTFKSDDKSQTQLGELIASNAIEYEIAQIRNRLAGGQPGITSTQQLMDESMQHISASWPRLSGKARQVANTRINDALKQGLAARNAVGIGAGATYTRQNQAANSNPASNKSTEQFIKQASSQLIPVLPDATPENIKHTAKEMNISVEEVVKRLVEKAKNNRGA